MMDAPHEFLIFQYGTVYQRQAFPITHTHARARTPPCKIRHLCAVCILQGGVYYKQWRTPAYLMHLHLQPVTHEQHLLPHPSL
jgi:hypothetical protein